MSPRKYLHIPMSKSIKPKKPKKVNKKRQARINKRKSLVEWSNLVKERDGYTCQVCGIKKGELTKNGKVVVFNSHHILAKEGAYTHMMFDVDNGICLCQNCHRFSRVNSPHRQEFVFFVWLMINRTEQFKKLMSCINSSNKVENEQSK